MVRSCESLSAENVSPIIAKWREKLPSRRRKRACRYTGGLESFAEPMAALADEIERSTS